MALIFLLVCLTVIGTEFRRGDSIYRYSLLGPFVFVAFLGPQLIGLESRKDLPNGAVAMVAGMSALCVLLIAAGAYTARRRRVPPAAHYMRRSALLLASVLLSLVGAGAFLLMSRLPDELRLASLPSGQLVAFSFFAQLVPYGMAIAALLYATTRSCAALTVLAVDLLLYADRFLVGARRGEAAAALAIVALAMRFGRNKVVPKSLFVIVAVLGTLFVFSTGEYRQGVSDTTLAETISRIDFLENVGEVFRNGGPEAEVAAYQIAATARRNDFDYGAFHWNSIVFRYVPAQLLGPEFKAALFVGSPGNSAYEEYGFVSQTGSTATGVADAFHSFWYFGALLFFLMAYVLERLYLRALRGDAHAQILYMLMLVNGLHAITHNTSWFFTPWIHFGLFLLPCLWLARTRRPAQIPPSQ